MKLTHLAFALFLVIATDAQAFNRGRQVQPPPTPRPTADNPTPRPTGEPPRGAVITLACDDSCTSNQRAELPTLEKKVNETLTSDCFSAYILDPAHRLDYALGLSRQAILARLREPTRLTVNYYWRKWTAAVGYESAADFTTIHLNGAKLGAWSACEKASLIGHEFSHTKKFFHEGNSPGPNYYSVPYQVNHAFEDAGCCR